MKNIYVTWHYTTHGIAYLKNILSAFYLEYNFNDKINLNNLQQEQLNLVFDDPKKRGFLFDEIIYLTVPQTTLDKLSSRRHAYNKTILEDPLIIKFGLYDVFDAILNNNDICYDIEKEFEYVQQYFPSKLNDYKNLIWRNMQHYPISEQIKWLENHSNFNNVYKVKLKVKEFDIDDLRDESQIAKNISTWITKYFKDKIAFKPIINVSLGSSETQVVWHILAESNQLPNNTRFIKTYDHKNDVLENRFKNFGINEISTNLISTITNTLKPYDVPQSESRKLVNHLMQVFLKQGFSILLIGERGTGKSQIISNAAKQGKNVIQANCASFADDSKAEAELFGYSKGAFTGANIDKNGLLVEAHDGVLFLDEVHHLSKLVQAKLMKALQTDEKNLMSIRKLNSTKEEKVKCKLIFATNKTINELKNILLPDFYDRIVQYVIMIPPLRETKADRLEDWATIWRQLKFQDPAPNEKKLENWLTQQPLYGNFRDLQKIAMYYNVFSKFDDETKRLIKEKTAFDYTKNQFEKYYSPPQTDNQKFNFVTNKTTKEMLADYKYELQKWAVAEFKLKKSAIEHFQYLGDTVTEKSFTDWKNKASLKEK